MYEYIIGNIMEIQEDYLVLENNGIGYKIYVSNNSLSNIDNRENVKIYTYFNMRDDGIFLYGFATREELDMFELLLLVSKIGPKIAMGILSVLTPNDIKLGIINNNTEILCKAPGIGKKTASRIILELKDRIDENIVVNDNLNITMEDDSVVEATNALMGLEYTKSEIDRALAKVDITGLTTEEIIRITLKNMSKK
ncbi:Holliday junction branch migration protein RuvA [Anaerosalibacter bizertensis]|uniref:Holliday junction branch migration complex subunit RuvA n=1 Tax=Anaerosalibacter bizertensis TaxID=932217 RepID=A0A844FJQ2_9FIRM|nr:Holliday junction branch migration protein RuvA [Anaerosalibacter bizertensis]MSS44138.1 Holliday junction branch migration protein RuvA [Anaerosalibacter bizertensis]HHV27775.1 Holliday junction branch migration protein RuvA [Tissierellia bacterium]